MTILKFMKNQDEHLIKMFSDMFSYSKDSNLSDRSSLFYPSAGRDFITPLILGLPYCRNFYFYERCTPKQLPNINKIIEAIKGVSSPSKAIYWKEDESNHFCDFETDGITRRLNWIHNDNTDFLERDAELCFYFHRGDSWGEGGSGQQWDSILLPDLITKIPNKSLCFFVTDGEPGGFEHRSVSDFLLEVKIVKVINRMYHVGKFIGRT